VGSPTALTVGLTRHRLTEQPHTSLATLFETVEAVTATHFQVQLLPSHLSAVPASLRRSMWLEFLRSCEVVVTDQPLLPLQLRAEHALPFRLLYLPLGTFPRGASQFRQGLPFLGDRDRIVFSCTSDLRIFRSLVADCLAETAILPFSVDLQRFRPPALDARQSLRRQFGISDEDVLFLYVGRVTAEKNVHGLLQVMDAVMLRARRARLLVVGPVADAEFSEFGTGPYDMTSILHQIRQSSPRLADSVLLAPGCHREALPAFHGMADAFINLTLHHDENFGYALVEAMACGLPTVATDWGGLKDSVVHGETGFRIPTRVSRRGVQIDQWCAVECCRALVESTELRQRMGRAARERAEVRYGCPAFSRVWQRLLSEEPAARASTGTGNRFTDFGLRFQRAFGGLDRPRYDANTYPLYAQLIAPYVSDGGGENALVRDPVVFLQPLSFQLAGRNIDILDPLWPGRFALNELEAALVDHLEERLLEADRPFPLRSELAAQLPTDRDDQALDEALLRLEGLGIVGQSHSQGSLT
jgi:glycosyltransferase involved in cell wall biosynthesis